MSPPRVFYPRRLDLPNPVQSVHREVSKHLDGYELIAFVNSSQNSLQETISNVYIIPADATIIWKAVQFLRAYTGRYDIIHTGPASRDRFGKLTAHRGAAWVHTLHAAPTSPQQIALNKTLCKNADQVTAVSPYVKSWAEDTIDATVNKVIPNGVDLGKFTPQASPTHEDQVLFVGRLCDQKHPEMMIAIAREFSDLSFNIAGTGPLQAELEKDAPENVDFLGHVPWEELRGLYAKAAVTVCPGENEGFGMVVLESIASGTPVLALDGGNHSNLIGQDGGILCQTLKKEEWINNLNRILFEDHDLNPRRVAEMYSWQKIASQYKRLYELLL
ncbi:glycosyltransferase family 4 protein [Natronomonas salina]|uniref:glycosyltransferase family 4 protein n=1 Tax=Natronomonas salina TaxID=1710540 RepID=UPI0015B4E731|nr:glycosyltransferase family 4 protein [Natronomonas salina]QLD90794.1 glycosyltransferase family 4 protein [Natronomonas salina]